MQSVIYRFRASSVVEKSNVQIMSEQMQTQIVTIMMTTTPARLVKEKKKKNTYGRANDGKMT